MGGALGPGAGPGLGALGGEILELREALSDLRLAQEMQSSEAKKKEKKKKKGDKKKKKKGKSSSTSGTAKSSSSSSSSSGPLVWSSKASKKRKISDKQLAKANTLRFKKRADLLNYHMKYPGALGAHFLLQVQAKLGRTAPGSTRDLSAIDVSSWIAQSAEFKEVRDQREVQHLSRILAELGADRQGAAVDLIVQRLREVRFAKSAGQSWEKAAPISLLPSGSSASTALPDVAFAL